MVGALACTVGRVSTCDVGVAVVDAVRSGAETGVGAGVGSWLRWYAATASWFAPAAYSAPPRAVAPATAATFFFVLDLVSANPDAAGLGGTAV